MSRRGIPKAGASWFLSEWMDALGVTQAEMCRRTDWSKATASQLYTGKQDYSPAVVSAAARALNADPYELLMPYERAMAFRRMREDAIRIVADNVELKDGTNG